MLDEKNSIENNNLAGKVSNKKKSFSEAFKEYSTELKIGLLFTVFYFFSIVSSLYQNLEEEVIISTNGFLSKYSGMISLSLLVLLSCSCGIIILIYKELSIRKKEIIDTVVFKPLIEETIFRFFPILFYIYLIEFGYQLDNIIVKLIIYSVFTAIWSYLHQKTTLEEAYLTGFGYYYLLGFIYLFLAEITFIIPIILHSLYNLIALFYNQSLDKVSNSDSQIKGDI